VQSTQVFAVVIDRTSAQAMCVSPVGTNRGEPLSCRAVTWPAYLDFRLPAVGAAQEIELASARLSRCVTPANRVSVTRSEDMLSREEGSSAARSDHSQTSHLRTHWSAIESRYTTPKWRAGAACGACRLTGDCRYRYCVMSTCTLSLITCYITELSQPNGIFVVPRTNL
jgi:hypothetical protein